MKKYLIVTGVAAIILSGCEPTTRLYQTPPTYFGISHSVPVPDSAKQLSISASVMLPPAAELRSEYRLNKYFLVNVSYFGNLGAYSHFSNNDIDYRYNTNSFDCQAEYFVKRNNKHGLFILVGYGWGHTTSVVPEYDNSMQFIYKGNFSRFTVTSGIDLVKNTKGRLTLSSRQSFIQFDKYELPETTYNNKRQFLTDIMLKCSVAVKNIRFNIFLGSFLNGLQGGDRQSDQKPEQWRIERFFAGVNLSYKFSINKKGTR